MKFKAGDPIAVDFDGTCVTHEYPKIGRSIGAQKVLRRIVENGGKLILWTMRSGKHLDDAVKWFEDNEISLYGIQRNPTQDEWSDSPKAYAKIYIDDAALGCPLRENRFDGNPSSRPYVDWDAVESYLFEESDSEKIGRLSQQLYVDIRSFVGEINDEITRAQMTQRLLDYFRDIQFFIPAFVFDTSKVGFCAMKNSNDILEFNAYTLNCFKRLELYCQ
jgi:hypothetical protein